MQTSLIYQNFGGINIVPTIRLGNAEIARSLGRNLAQCGASATCTASVVVPLVPAGTLYEPRLQQLDVRFTRNIRFNRYRIRGDLDIANIFNAGNVLSAQQGYGPTYLNVLQIMGGRLVKVGARFDF
jgi:hypothetical protein